MSTPVQFSLFTVLGRPYSAALARADLRVKVMDEMGKVYGSIPIDDASCPECGGDIVLVLHLTCPTAYCRCGYLLDVGPDVDEEV